MESIPEERRNTSNVKLTDKVLALEQRISMKEKVDETNKESKLWNFPRIWKRAFSKSVKKPNLDKILVIYFNAKGHIEPPVLVPLYDGSMVIYKNKAYEFDPRAVWTVGHGKKIVKCTCIKEIDRRPISNLDISEIKARGDSTDSDEILLKMFKRAQIDKLKKPLNASIWLWIVIAAIIGVVFFVFVK